MTDDDHTRLLRALLMPAAAVREILPTMLERCQHVPALLTVKADMVPGYAVTFTGIRLTGEANRRLRKARDYLTRA